MNDELWISALGLRTKDYELGIVGQTFRFTKF
jgi:hypothetical protein